MDIHNQEELTAHESVEIIRTKNNIVPEDSVWTFNGGDLEPLPNRKWQSAFGVSSSEALLLERAWKIHSHSFERKEFS